MNWLAIEIILIVSIIIFTILVYKYIIIYRLLQNSNLHLEETKLKLLEQEEKFVRLKDKMSEANLELLKRNEEFEEQKFKLAESNERWRVRVAGSVLDGMLPKTSCLR